MELIDREKLINEIEKECKDTGDILDADDCIFVINDQPTVNTWISVEDRLPKIEEVVLVLTDSGRYIGNLEKSGIWWFDEWSTTLENPNEGIIAWMPIPEYKEQEDD